MGLMDFFSKWVICPECRHKGARIVFGKVSCPDSRCKKYDPNLVIQPELSLNSPGASKSFLRGDFDPGVQSLTVRYRNYLGEDKTYQIDKTSLVAKEQRNYVSALAAPTGLRINFKKKFIKNLSEIEECLRAQLKEKQEITVKYRNFKGEEMSFIGDANAIKQVGDRIKIMVKYKGFKSWKWKKYCLRKERIQNFSEIGKYLS